MSTGTFREMAHLADERDQAFAALAALRVQYHDAIASLNASVEATVAAQHERDAALDTISRVWAVVLSSNAALVVDRVRKALEPAQASPQEAARATEAPEGPELHQWDSSPATGLTDTSNPTKGATK
jgi:hypothetical protein